MQLHGIVLADMDRSVRAGDDFYIYANGGWIKRTVLPPDRSLIDPYGGDAYDGSNDLTRRRTASVIEGAVHANALAGSDVRKIADLYRSFMDEATIEARGVTPVRSRLDVIAAIHDKHDLAHVLGETLRADVDPLNSGILHTPNLFGLWVAPGFDDSEHYSAYLLQGGLEMPDREYYLADNESMRDIRVKYRAHIAAMLKLVGFTDSEIRAQRIFELERAIAEKHVSLSDEQDIQKANNPWKQADFANKAPGLDWVEYFRGAGLSRQAGFIVWQPTAFAGESALVASMGLDTWKDWLAFHLIEDYSPVLPKVFADENFSFFERTLGGTSEQRPRSQRGIAAVNALLGDAVGKIYAQRYFSPETKSQIQALVNSLIVAYRQRIDKLSWMDAATKAEAKAKLTALYVGIGYPETWVDYSEYHVKPEDLFGNLWRNRLFEYQHALAQLGRGVDRKEWASHLYPQTVNMIQLPLQNAINIPAANFQPPYFDPQAPAAVNYGAMGATIAHEISHVFDPQGSTFDSAGRVRNWWKPADQAHFDEATARLAAQYDAYKPFPDLAVNGKQTLAENVADLGGLAAAYDAYHATLSAKAAPIENGLSGDQQFFLAFAQVWAAKSSEEWLRQQVMTDTHAPERYRVATVRNLDPWYASFDVRSGDKLYLPPPERISIW